MKRNFTIPVLVFAVLGLLSPWGAANLLAQTKPQTKAEPAKKNAERKPPQKAPDLKTVAAEFGVDPATVKTFGVDKPGTNPDPKTVWFKEGKLYRIEKFDRGYTHFSEEKPGMVMPVKVLPAWMEVYRQDDKDVWAWIPLIKPAKQIAREQAAKKALTPAQIETLEKLKKEFVPVTLPASPKHVIFQDSSTGLPTSGSWRNVAAFGDVNGDGHMDLVTPPQRGGMASMFPYIFLGDGKGGWTPMRGIRWPKRIDYGGVALADFDHDGHLDLAFAVHLQGPAVFLSDGKGGFVDASNGLPKSFPSKAVLAVDVDHDGWPDLVFLSEGPTMHDVGSEGPSYPLRVYLNRDKGHRWELVPVAAPGKNAAGDSLAAGDFNGDGVVDVATSSITYGGPDVLYVSTGSTRWKSFGRDPVHGNDAFPGFSYYYGTATGRFTAEKADEALLGFVRVWQSGLVMGAVEPPKLTSISGIDFVRVVDGNVVRKPMVAWEGRFPPVAIATGDFDGDGNLDVAYLVRTEGGPAELHVLLGNGAGGFSEASVEGVSLPHNNVYGLAVGDVNGDGLPDLAMLFEDSERSIGKRDGSVHVFLNRTGKAK